MAAETPNVGPAPNAPCISWMYRASSIPLVSVLTGTRRTVVIECAPSLPPAARPAAVLVDEFGAAVLAGALICGKGLTQGIGAS